MRSLRAIKQPQTPSLTKSPSTCGGKCLVGSLSHSRICSLRSFARALIATVEVINSIRKMPNYHSTMENVPARFLLDHSVSLAWRLTGDNHSHSIRTFVHRLMPPAWGNLDPFLRVKNKEMILNLQSQCSLRDEEKLSGMLVSMSGLTFARRHEFFNNAEACCFHQMPAIAVCSVQAVPFVVFGRFYTDDSFWHEFCFRKFSLHIGRSSSVLRPLAPHHHRHLPFRVISFLGLAP